MSFNLNRYNQAGDLYVRALTAAYRKGRRLDDPAFAEWQDPQIWDTVRRDPVIAHAMQQRRHLVAGREWRLEPASDDPVDEAAAAVMEELLKQVHRFGEARFNLASAVFRGRSWAFIEGHRQKLRLGGSSERLTWWTPTRLRHVEKWRFRQFVEEEKGEPVWKFWSLKEEDWKEISPEQMAWFVAHVYEDVEASLGYGRGLLEAVYFFHYFKTQLLRKGLTGADRWALGIVKVGLEGLRDASTGKTNDDVRQEWLDSLTDMRTEHVLAHDKEDELEVLTGGMEGHQIVTNLIGYLDRSLTRLILGAVLPTGGDEGAGSFARAQVEENSTEALIQFDRRLLDETLTKDLVGAIWERNLQTLAQLNLAGAAQPRFLTVQEKREDPTESARVVATLVQAGVELRRDEVYQKTGFTQPGAEDEVVVGPSAVPGLGGGGGFEPPGPLRTSSANGRPRGPIPATATPGGDPGAQDWAMRLFGMIFDELRALRAERPRAPAPLDPQVYAMMAQLANRPGSSPLQMRFDQAQFTMPDQPVQFNVPEVHVPPATVYNEIRVPQVVPDVKVAAPVVQYQAPAPPTPEVTVNPTINVSPTPVEVKVHNELPAQARRVDIQFKRDPMGNVQSATGKSEPEE